MYMGVTLILRPLQRCEMKTRASTFISNDLKHRQSVCLCSLVAVSRDPRGQPYTPIQLADSRTTTTTVPWLRAVASASNQQVSRSQGLPAGKHYHLSSLWGTRDPPQSFTITVNCFCWHILYLHAYSSIKKQIRKHRRHMALIMRG